jgi:hypothetical protein
MQQFHIEKPFKKTISFGSTGSILHSKRTCRMKTHAEEELLAISARQEAFLRKLLA